MRVHDDQRESLSTMNRVVGSDLTNPSPVQ